MFDATVISCMYMLFCFDSLSFCDYVIISPTFIIYYHIQGSGVGTIILEGVSKGAFLQVMRYLYANQLQPDVAPSILIELLTGKCAPCAIICLRQRLKLVIKGDSFVAINHSWGLTGIP